MSRGVVGDGQTVDQPLGPATFTVSETPEGVATAISVLSAGMSTTGPERSHPDYRTHPPLVEIGDETYIPPRVREMVPQTDIIIDVPANYDELFVIAPLAYYLGASVRIGSGTARLSAPGVHKSFGSLSEIQFEAAALLRRVFFLDCLVRDVPDEEPPYQRIILDKIGLNPESIRAATPGERLAAYMGVKQASIMSELPTWHLSTYVSPSSDMIPSLPYLLDDLSLIYPPSARPIDEKELLSEALDDFYRGSVANIEMVAPDLQPGDLHAWLANGTPTGAYVPSVAAFRNRLATPAPEAPLDITVVLNDDGMNDELEKVARFYNESDRTTTMHRSLSVDELAQVFESRQDFVHYIGHCETGGLQCPDGELDIESLSSVGARTFFLNACGSYYQGQALIERGSVAGAVTLREVFNKPASNVGTTFARLFINGFGIERAMQLARRQIMMSTDYTVVGDGTYTLTDDKAAIARLNKNGTTYRLSYTVDPDRYPGGSYCAPFELWTRLSGTSATTELDRADVPRVLDGLSCPVIFDEDLCWSDELAAEFLSTEYE
ncbi:CHAT domain-containing protein [Halocatena marina]|uniref:CHAT domain-containing protein n=1 Tax=Halocatena marina TaxID=2934937 RepID=A0ABD5YJB5_9EURY|nr:CHAT domain-containing protein [Halocatena marina]